MQEFDLSCGAAALATILRYQHGDAVTERERSTACRMTSSAILRPQSTWLLSHSSNGSRTIAETSLICSGSFASCTRLSYFSAALQNSFDGRGRSDAASSELSARLGTPSNLLAHHLKQLKLPTVLREYDKVARGES